MVLWDRENQKTSSFILANAPQSKKKIISLIICLGSYFHWVLLIKYPDNWHFKIFFLVFYLVFCFLQEGQVGTLLNCLYVNLKLQLTFEQQGFELGRSTYMEIIFNSNCYSIEWSKVLWICGCKTAGMEELTVSHMRTFHCGSWGGGQLMPQHLHCSRVNWILGKTCLIPNNWIAFAYHKVTCW